MSEVRETSLHRVMVVVHSAHTAWCTESGLILLKGQKHILLRVHPALHEELVREILTRCTRIHVTLSEGSLLLLRVALEWVNSDGAPEHMTIRGLARTLCAPTHLLVRLQRTWRRKRAERAERAERRRGAFAMGMHARLGGASLLHALNDDVLAIILGVGRTCA